MRHPVARYAFRLVCSCVAVPGGGVGSEFPHAWAWQPDVGSAAVGPQDRGVPSQKGQGTRSRFTL
jgi:hypothetical protein